MTNLPTLDTVAILRNHGIRPRRRLGQNFLRDPAALIQIAAEAGIGRTDSVLEIGSGLGSLTRHLSQAAANVVAVELDPVLVSIAAEVLQSLTNVRLVCADMLDLDPGDLGLPPGYIVAANIPYYLTSPILRHLLESEPKPSRMVLTVQKEVAHRICAVPPEMSILAISVQVYGRPQIVADIPAAAFFPVPKVDSSVVRVECFDVPIISPALLPTFFRVVKSGFRHKRKTLRNTLSSGLGIAVGAARELLLAVDIDPRRRAETLSLAEWRQLSEHARGYGA